jgi:hypothetical protein
LALLTSHSKTYAILPNINLLTHIPQQIFGNIWMETFCSVVLCYNIP